MPFLDGKPWQPTAPLDGCTFGAGSKLFRVPQTGEIFASYNQYLDRLRLLQSSRWTSVKGTSGLNFSQACLEDSQRKQADIQGAAALELVLRRAHHSELPLTRLVQDIHMAQGSPSSNKENAIFRPGAEMPKSTFTSAEEIRNILNQATEVKQMGDKQIWIAKPEFQERFSLAKQLPSHLAVVEPITNTGPVVNGVWRPTKQAVSPKPSNKRKGEGQTEENGGAKKKPKASLTSCPTAKPPPPPLRTVEEEEARLTDGTHKAAIFRALKEAGSEGFSIAQIAEAAQKQGTKEYDDKSRNLISSTIMADPTFVRVRHKTYAIRALMGDKPYDAIGGRAPKTSKKANSLEAPAANVGAQVTKSPGKQAVGDGRVEKPTMNGHAGPSSPKEAPPLLTVEEEESRLKPGTNKEVIFKVLKNAGHEGMTLNQIIDGARAAELKDYKDTQKNMIATVLIGHPTFVRVKKGVYALRALMDGRPYESIGVPKPHKAKEPKAEPEAGIQQAAPIKGDAPAAQANGLHNDSESAESRTKNEVILMDVRKTLDAHRKALERALASEQKAEERVRTATEAGAAAEPLPKTPAKVSAVESLGEKPSFEVSAEQAVFQGDVNNPEDIEQHARTLRDLRDRLVQQRQEWDTKFLAAKKEDEKASKVSELLKAQRALKSAKKRVADNRSSIHQASQALYEASRAVHKEKSKKAADEKREKDKQMNEEKKAQEKKAREEARLAERERKKALALDAKRYPIDDLQLLEELHKRAVSSGEAGPALDVPLPEEWMTIDDSEATSSLLFIADFLSQFSKSIKISDLPTYNTLVELLEPSTAKGQEQKAKDLAEIYERLLEVLLQDADEESEEETWLELLDSSTLGDILRRYLISQKETSPSLFKPVLTSTALGALLEGGIESLTGNQHQALLTLLCDDILSSEKLRDALQERMEGGGDVRREMREAVAEKKGELKELLDAEKEKRKQERNEKRAAKKAKDAALKLQKEQNNPTTEQENGGEDAKEKTPLIEAQPEEIKPDMEAGADEEAEEVEPSWELPPELQDYLGDPTDRKGLLTWRQKQQSTRQKLEKAKEKWHAAARERAKKREALQRAKQEEERAKERAKAAAEEEVVRQQEAYEKELEKFSIRRMPLGLDRHYRQYWWGIAGQRSVIYVERPGEEWSVMTTVAEVDSLLGALDKRGVRELALHGALEKIYPAVTQAMKKAQTFAKQKPEVETNRYSQRERTQAVFFSPSKEVQGNPGAAQEESSQGLSWSTVQALEGIVTCLSNLQRELSSWGCPPPEDGWKTWSLAYRNAKKDAKLSMQEEGSIGGIQATLKTCLLEAEEMLYSLTRSKESTPEAADVDEKVREGSKEGSQTDSEDTKPSLWEDTEERESWRHWVMEGKILSSTAYSAAVLAKLGTELLESLDPPAKAKSKPAPKVAPAKGKARPSSAGNTRAKAPEKSKKPAPKPSAKEERPKPTQERRTRADSKPHTQSDPMKKTRKSTLEEEKLDTKSNKRKAAQPPQGSMRITRARAK